MPSISLVFFPVKDRIKFKLLLIKCKALTLSFSYYLSSLFSIKKSPPSLCQLGFSTHHLVVWVTTPLSRVLSKFWTHSISTSINLYHSPCSRPDWRFHFSVFAFYDFLTLRRLSTLCQWSAIKGTVQEHVHYILFPFVLFLVLNLVIYLFVIHWCS